MLRTWLQVLGVPNVVLADLGGEFEREVKEELEAFGCKLPSAAAYNPTQNAVCERHGGAWKAHAKALALEFYLSFQ
eukprot:4421330-Lingulodinium_polyedra.AAC.1